MGLSGSSLETYETNSASIEPPFELPNTTRDGKWQKVTEKRHDLPVKQVPNGVHHRVKGVGRQGSFGKE